MALEKLSFPRQQYATVLSIAVTQFSLVFMLSAVAVAIPALGHEFGAKAGELSLVESGYIAAASMFLFPATRIAKIFGQGFIFALGVGIFSFMSLLLPLSQNIAGFITLRVLQGFGGAMMITTGLVIVTALFPHSGRARALGITSCGIYLGLSLGPGLGGFIVSSLGWRWIFYIGFLPCFLSLLLCLKTIQVKPVRGEMLPFDWGGAFFVGLGMFGLSFGGAAFHSAMGKWMTLGGVLGLVCFIFYEKHRAYPLLEVDIVQKNRLLFYSCLAQFFNYTATFGTTFLLSLYLQIVQGMEAREAGFILTIQPLVMAALSPVAGNAAEKISGRFLAAVGMGLSAFALGMAVFLQWDSSLWYTGIILLLMGGGTALFVPANMSIIMGSVEKQHYGLASALTAGMRTLGMTLCLVFIGAAFAVVIGPQEVTGENAMELLQVMQFCFALFTCTAFFGIWLILKSRP